MIWNPAHISKVYEALTAIADSRIELVSENKAHCYSSSKGKYYEVEYDMTNNKIMSNDNTAYYTDSVSYPMIAMLMLKGVISYNQKLLPILKGIYWKDVNQKFNNDYDLAIEYVLTDLKSKKVDTEFVKTEVEKIFQEVGKLKLGRLGEKVKPPAGY